MNSPSNCHFSSVTAAHRSSPNPALRTFSSEPYSSQQVVSQRAPKASSLPARRCGNLLHSSAASQAVCVCIKLIYILTRIKTHTLVCHNNYISCKRKCLILSCTWGGQLLVRPSAPDKHTSSAAWYANSTGIHTATASAIAFSTQWSLAVKAV